MFFASTQNLQQMVTNPVVNTSLGNLSFLIKQSLTQNINLIVIDKFKKLDIELEI